MRYIAFILFVTFSLGPVTGFAEPVCTDAMGNKVRDKNCVAKSAVTTNIPVKANKLSDDNTVETVKRFYKAMSEHDSMAAARLLSDTFTSEVRQDNTPTVRNNKSTMIRGLEMVLDATRLYNAKIDCSIKQRTPNAYALSCLVDEQGIVMDQFRRTLSDQSVTVVLDDGFAKIAKIISVHRN